MRVKIERKDLENDNAFVSDETTALIHQSEPTCLGVKKFAAAGCIALALGSVTAAIISYMTHREESEGDASIETPQITYSFSAPYQGGGNIVINNNNDFDIIITDIQFMTNVVINTTKEGVIYGDLAPWGEAKISTVASNGNFQTYKITEPLNQITISANSNKNFTYVFEKALGIANVGTLPTAVSVSTSEGTFSLPVANQCQNSACSDPYNGKIVGGYYTNWDMYQRKYNAKDIPVAKLNHVYYAFINYDQDGNIKLFDPYSDNIQLPALMQLKQQFPYLKVCLSFGGWTLSSNFPALAQNPVARDNFSRNVLGMLQQFNFSGVDIDWEFPMQQDSNNFVLLLKSLREHLDASGQSFEISIATSGGQDKVDAIGSNWKEVAKYVNYINLMAYDYNGQWSSLSDYQSPLYLPSNDPNGRMLSINTSISLYENYQFPKEKIVLGLPAYFRGARVSNMQNNGLWQPITGAAPGQYEMGIFDYTCVVSKNCYGGASMPSDCIYLNEQQSLYGNFSHTPSIACANELSLYTGDSTTSVKDKSCFAKDKNLKGVFFWALSGDERNNDQKSLLTAASQTFQGAPCQQTKSAEGESSLVIYEQPISNEYEWREFVQKVQENITASYSGGFFFTLFFQGIDKLTERFIEKLMPKTLLASEDQAMVYYSLKTVVYFSVLYYMDASILPAAISKLIAISLEKLGCSNTKSQLTGAAASFCLSLSKLDLNSYENIFIATLNFLSSYAGAYTASLASGAINNCASTVTSQVSRWANGMRNFGLFKTNTDQFISTSNEHQRVYTV